MTACRPNKRGIGMVFQRYALFPNMTVAQNVAFPLMGRCRRPRSASTQRTSKELGSSRWTAMEARIRRNSRVGSSSVSRWRGRSRYEPRILLHGRTARRARPQAAQGDAAGAEAPAARARHTIIFVTHDQQEAMALADRIAIMAEGQVQQVGAPEELYHSPRQRLRGAVVSGKVNPAPRSRSDRSCRAESHPCACTDGGAVECFGA